MNARRSVLLLATVALLVPLLSAVPTAASAAGTPPSGAGRPEVSGNTHHDTSRPLRDVPSKGRSAINQERPLKPLPVAKGSGAPDAAVQPSTGTSIATTNGLDIAGVGNGDYGFAPNAAPPDTSGAVGATQYVQWANESLAVFDKTSGAIVAGFPKAGNTLWAGFGGGCEANNDGDPIAQYDKAAGRWVLSQFSVTNPATYGYLQCVAVSTSSDATGTYNRYAFSYGGSEFNDYPKLGVWPDGYYVTYNIFTNGSTFAGAKSCAFDRAKMLAGAAATQVCFQLGTSFGGVLPADLDGTTAPPAGAPNPQLNFGSNALNVWKFHADFATPANSTYTGPMVVPVTAFSPACNGGGTCIPQADTAQKLDSLADRLMYRLAYRNFGGHESLLVNHSVFASGNRRSQVTGVRWYELRNATPGAAFTPTVFQQGTYAPDGTSRWMGSIAMDKVGNIAVGYSASSPTTSPGIRYAARAANDAPGTLGAETTVALPSTGSQLANLSRWGDYSAMSVDPGDDCTFWYTTEYLKSNGTFNWSTRIASFKLAGC